MNTPEEQASKEEQRLLKAMNNKRKSVAVIKKQPSKETVDPSPLPAVKEAPAKIETQKSIETVKENGNQTPSTTASQTQPEVQQPIKQVTATASPRDLSKRHSMYNVNNNIVQRLVQKEEERLNKTIDKNSGDRAPVTKNPSSSNLVKPPTPAPSNTNTNFNLTNSGTRQRPPSVILTGGVSANLGRARSQSHFNGPIVTNSSIVKQPSSNNIVVAPKPETQIGKSNSSPIVPSPNSSVKEKTAVPATTPSTSGSSTSSSAAAAREKRMSLAAEKTKELHNKFDSIASLARQSSQDDLLNKNGNNSEPKTITPPPEQKPQSSSSNEFDDILNIISGIEKQAADQRKESQRDHERKHLSSSKSASRLSMSDLSAIDGILATLSQPIPPTVPAKTEPVTPPVQEKKITIYTLQLIPPSDLPTEAQKFISSVVTSGRKVIGILKLDEVNKFDPELLFSSINDFVSLITYGTDILKISSESKQGIVQSASEFANIAIKFLNDAERHISQGLWRLSEYDDYSEKVLDHLQRTLLILKNNSKSAVTPAPVQKQNYMSDIAIEASAIAGQLLSAIKESNSSFDKFSATLEELVKKVRQGIAEIQDQNLKQQIANKLKELLQKGIQLANTAPSTAERERKEVVGSIAELLKLLATSI